MSTKSVLSSIVSRRNWLKTGLKDSYWRPTRKETADLILLLGVCANEIQELEARIPPVRLVK